MGIAFHFPLLIIFLPALVAIAIPVIRSIPAARMLTLMIHLVLVGMSVWLVFTLWYSPYDYFIYLMGYFPSPYGNVIRVGMLEALLACVFSVITLLCVLGTDYDTLRDIPKSRQRLYHCMINLLSCSLMALVFANDIFTAYVFVEVNTLAACSIVAIKENRATLRATVKYLFLSVMGSGLFLLATAILFSITGHLVMEPIHDSIVVLFANGEYQLLLTITILFFIVSMAVKSALFPFHTWLPDAHGSATTASSALLSGLVLKGYVVLLLKLLHRVYGIELAIELGILPILFMLGVTGMIAGSVMALLQSNIKRLIAYSSVAQIGYIFLGMGLSSIGGFTAASFQIIAHSFTKSMLFIAAGALINAAGSYNIADLTGTARKNKVAGAAFTVGALSMMGIPFFAGFVSKFYLAGAAVQSNTALWTTLSVLAISTFLNGLYYFPVVARIYSKQTSPAAATPQALPAVNGSLTSAFGARATLVFMIVANISLGIFFAPLLRMLEAGFLGLG